jgi:lipoate---protein ligase
VTVAFPDVPANPSFSLHFPVIDEQVVVLGRSQSAEVRGLPWARRLSGGGAVLLTPGEVVWADVVVPRGHPLWDDDVGRASWWLGERWVDALGLADAEVHRGGVVRCTPWCKAVCFGGLGPGEVHIEQRKVVGISQRRTRAGALFQCAVNLRWDPTTLVAALGLPQAAVGELQDAVIAVDRPEPDVKSALVAAFDELDPAL